MCVFEHSAANILVADNGADTCQRDIEPGRFRQLRGEQSQLHLAGASRFCLQCQSENRGLWRMRFEIEMKQLDPELLVIGRQRRPDRACMCRAAFELQCDADAKPEQAHELLHGESAVRA